MRSAFWLLIAAGCNQVYGLDPTRVRDLEPPACSTVQFGSPAPLDQFDDGDRELDPQLSSDGTELWYVSNTTGTSNRYLMFRGVRASDTGPFVVSLVELVDNTRSNGSPAQTADGRRLMFSVGDELYEGIRQDPRAFPFDSVVAVNGFGQFPNGIDELDLTWDGLRMYYVAEGALWFAHREDRDQPFIEHRKLLEAAIGALTISGDELELFYSPSNVPGEELPLYRRARTSLAETFGAEQLVLDEGITPDIAPTSSKMMVGRDGTLAELTRRCDEEG